MTVLNNGVTGHRGNPEAAPENTLAGFASAIALGVDFLETDVHESADGVLFLCHDATTGRTCGTDLAIAETEAAEAVFLPRRFFLFFRPVMTAAARYSATAPTAAAVAAITTTV